MPPIGSPALNVLKNFRLQSSSLLSNISENRLTYFSECDKSVQTFTANDTAISYLGKGMGKADQFSSIFWLILGLAVVYGSNRLGLGTLTHPGPGFFPVSSYVPSPQSGLSPRFC